MVPSRGVLNKRNLVTVQKHFKDSDTLPSAFSPLQLFRQEEKRREERREERRKERREQRREQRREEKRREETRREERREEKGEEKREEKRREKRNVTMDEHNWRQKTRSSYTVWCSL